MEEKGKVSPALRFKNLWDKIFLNYRFLKKKLYFFKEIYFITTSTYENFERARELQKSFWCFGFLTRRTIKVAHSLCDLGYLQLKADSNFIISTTFLFYCTQK